MYSASASVQSNPRRSVAGTALRGAGLARTDEDVSMKDIVGGVKRTTRHRPHEKPTRSKRLEKMELDAAASAKANNTLSARLKGSSGGSLLSIRGAGGSSSLASRLDAGPSQIPRRVGAPARNVISEPRVARGARSSGAPSVTILRQVVQQRYNPEAQFLNLERLADDEIMKKHKIPSLESTQAPKQLGPVLFKLAGELTPPCKTISLANNNLTNTHNLSSLNHYLPSLNALSLENNKIRSMRDLDGLSIKAAKASISSITELVLTGNPIKEEAITHSRIDTFRGDILRRFPMLAVLDGEALPRLAFDVEASTVNEAAAHKPTSNLPSITSFPVPMQPSLYLGGVDPVVAQFLTQYFTMFDTNRPALSVVYAPHATFSISANTSIPPRARKRGFMHSADMPHQKSLTWDYYRNQSRNLERLGSTGRTGADKAVDLMHNGPDAIMNALAKFPASKHDMAQPEKFCVDAFPMVGVLGGGVYGTDALFIHVHGEFAEGPTWGIRSFDRTFTLAVSPPGSPAQQNGWPCVIISDIFVIRSYSHADAWAPGELPMPSSAPPAPASTSTSTYTRSTGTKIQGEGSSAVSTNSSRALPHQQQPPANSLAQLQNDPLLNSVPDYQRPLLIQLAQQTGLTIQYAGQCLEMNGWDMQRALANFAEVKGGLPADAWLRR